MVMKFNVFNVDRLNLDSAFGAQVWSSCDHNIDTGKHRAKHWRHIIGIISEIS